MMNTTTAAPITTPEVKMSITMDVDDPAAFVSEPGSVGAVRTAIAQVANVDVNDVRVVLFVKTLLRRLLIARRLERDVVGVNATITVVDEAAATTLQTSIAAVTPDAMSNATNVALEEAGLTQFTVNVTELAAVVVLPPPPPADPPGPPSGTANCASVRWKAYYNPAPFVAVSAWLFSQA